MSWSDRWRGIRAIWRRRPAESGSTCASSTSSSKSSMPASHAAGAIRCSMSWRRKRMRVIALNRDDLADPATTKRWLDALRGRGSAAVAVDGRVRAQRRAHRRGDRRAYCEPAVGCRDIARDDRRACRTRGKSSIVNALLAPRGARRPKTAPASLGTHNGFALRRRSS